MLRESDDPLDAPLPQRRCHEGGSTRDLPAPKLQSGKFRGDETEVADEHLERVVAVVVLGAQHGRRVNRGGDEQAVAPRLERAVLPGDPELGTEHRVRGGRAEAAQDPWLDRGELRLPPRRAGLDLRGVGLLVEPDLARGSPFEVLHRIRDVHAVALDAGLDQRAIEQRTRGAHEWMTLAVFTVTGLLAHEHEIGVGRSLTEHCLGRSGVQITRLARDRVAAEFVEGCRHSPPVPGSCVGDTGEKAGEREQLLRMPDSSTTLHEPAEALRPETIEAHRAFVSLTEELEAVDWYNQRVDATADPDLRAVLAHNRDEEKEHAAMTLEWLRRRDRALDAHLRRYLFTDGPIAGREEAGSLAPANDLPGGELNIGSLIDHATSMGTPS